MLDKYRVEIIVATVGVLLVGLGVVVYRGGLGDAQGVEIVTTGERQEGGEGELVVDVAGAVVRPGVYKIKSGCRVGEAVDRAGGLSSEVDSEWVGKYLNRAEVVSDGQKIYIPVAGSNVGGSNLGSGGMGEKVNINTASQKELEALPGIGPATAEKIMTNRPFTRVEELSEKKLVGQKVYDGLVELVSVW